MFVKTKQVSTQYTRNRRLEKPLTYTRTKTVVVLACDQCRIVFERDLGKMDHRRLTDEYTHVCPNCDQKRFAQNKGVERRRLWNMSVDTDIDVTKI